MQTLLLPGSDPHTGWTPLHGDEKTEVQVGAETVSSDMTVQMVVTKPQSPSNSYHSRFSVSVGVWSPTWRKIHRCSGCVEFHATPQTLDSFPHQKWINQLPLKTLGLLAELKLSLYHYRSSLTFTCLFGHHLLLGTHIFTKLWAGKHSADHTRV
jgi:hypothetical protein